LDFRIGQVFENDCKKQNNDGEIDDPVNSQRDYNSTGED